MQSSFACETFSLLQVFAYAHGLQCYYIVNAMLSVSREIQFGESPHCYSNRDSAGKHTWYLLSIRYWDCRTMVPFSLQRH